MSYFLFLFRLCTRVICFLRLPHYFLVVRHYILLVDTQLSFLLLFFFCPFGLKNGRIFCPKF
jgi:hypothetical protein